MALDVQPQGNIYICRTPLEADYENQLTFASQSAQQSYFASTVVKSFDNSTYIRKDRGLKVNCNADEIRNCNYLYYRNTGFSSKIYYCFITDIEYLSENSTYIEVTTDVWQTWYFDLKWNRCLVEREHVSDDRIGVNTFPEGLELGPDYRVIKSQNIGPTDDIPCIVWGVSMLNNTSDNGTLSTLGVNAPFNVINGVASGLYYVVQNYNATEEWDSPEGFVRAYDLAGLGDAITTAFMVPQGFLTGEVMDEGFQITGTNTKTGESYTQHALYLMKGSFDAKKVANYEITRDYNFGTLGSTILSDIHNNKLWCYPYQYLVVSNNAGQSAIYHYEDFTNHLRVSDSDVVNPTFTLYYAHTPGGSTKLVPQQADNHCYKDYDASNSDYGYGDSVFMDYGITGAKFPQISWHNDAYTNWLTQNGVNLEVNTAQAVVSTISALGAGAISGAAATPESPFSGAMLGATNAAINGTSTIINTALRNYSQVESAKMLPDTTSGNINSGDVNWSMNQNVFTCRQMSIRAEYAHIIDEFFDRFGYKVNRLKVPEITSRTNWNYIKTIEANVDGDIPQKDLNTIRKTLNAGITFWHNPTTIYDYNQTNSIVN